MIRRLLLLGLVAGGVAAGILIKAPTNQARAAPALPTQVLRTPRVTLAGLHGHAVLINFWASWCGPCTAEAPALERFVQDGGRLVSVDWSDDLNSARAFISAHHWTFPVLADPDGDVGRSYGLDNLPATFVLNAQGRITNVLHGAQNVSQLQRAIRSA